LPSKKLHNKRFGQHRSSCALGISLVLALRLDQSMANGKAHQLSIVSALELAHDAAPIRVDAAELHTNDAGDFLAGVAFGDELQNLALARLSRFEALPFALVFIAHEPLEVVAQCVQG